MLMNHEAGFEHVKRLLPQKGYRLNMVTRLNRGRHMLVETSKEGKAGFINFYVMFKHTPIHSFNSFFPKFVEKYPLLAGYGESINVEWGDYANRRDSTLLYVYPNGAVYAIHIYTVRKICCEHKLIREQSRTNEYKLANGNGKTEEFNEKVYMFPIKLMDRFN